MDFLEFCLSEGLSLWLNSRDIDSHERIIEQREMELGTCLPDSQQPLMKEAQWEDLSTEPFWCVVPSTCHGVQQPMSESGLVTYLFGDFGSHVIFMYFNVVICNRDNNSLNPVEFLLGLHVMYLKQCVTCSKCSINVNCSVTSTRFFQQVWRIKDYLPQDTFFPRILIK